ncbi:MAG: UbiA-like polyprenyltransferase [Gemmatales bacterium]|nr:putative 4-hydroxybenzoate polyprenyltransferase [Gemmatales bacterium]MDW8175633.1 UbiA-like polyprenyltransferase [Gemmatales bacterium]
MGQRVRDFLELIRFSHTVFALPFALASAVLAWQREPFRWLDLLGIVLCMVLARSAAMGFNRLADRHYDAANPRTANRHLPSGRLSVASVAVFTTLCALGFLAATTIFVASNKNWWPLYLSLPVLGFILAYSYTKRFTWLSHFWLGASLMLAPWATWIALTGTLAGPAVWLGLAVFFWVAGFDTIYALQDVDFDRRAGLFSLPARWGVRPALWAARACHVLTIVFLIGVGLSAALGTMYFAGVVGIAALLVIEHWLVRRQEPDRINLAFFHVNSVISLGVLALVCADVWLGR